MLPSYGLGKLRECLADFPKCSGLPTAYRLTSEPLTLKRAFKMSSLAVFGSDKGFTLHSLRRGGIQACQSAGINLECIMKAGTWKSQAVNSYLNGSVVASASTVLGRILG